MLVVPMNAFGQTIGALSVYRDQATEGVGGGTALEMLRTASRNTNRRLREIAEEIADRDTGVHARSAGRLTTP